MSTTFWAVFLGVMAAYVVVTLFEGIVDEIRTKRISGYLEYLEDQSQDFLDELRTR
jgi:hypothetical protein